MVSDTAAFITGQTFVVAGGPNLAGILDYYLSSVLRVGTTHSGRC
jgi:hypothetical protein